MAELLGTPGEYGRITTELSGVIFKDPAADADDPEAGWQTADEYLSGNVRDKLRMAQLAAESRSEFKVNVDALTKAQPKDLEASEIDVRLGATWLAPSIVQQFMMETFQPPYRIRYNNSITVRYSPYTSEWRISNKSATGFGDIMATETYGTRRANAYKILEDTLNLRDSRVYDTIVENGKEKRVLNQNETTLAQQKQQAIKDAFAGWVWKDPQRRALLVKKYNELFNSTRPREYDGSHIHFVGMNPEINLREHQRNAVAHVLYGYNTLLAHEVGAGKSFEMAASAMELKRLGLCQKSLFVVPNHLTEQWASEFLRLYPNAKLLVTSKKDFEPANRKKFCARIATGDYDAVIIGHSQFEKIPLSAERQERLIQEQMDEIEEAIEEAKAQVGEHFTVKQLEKLRKSLKQKLKKLQGADRKDDVVTFEQLGVDRLFVDESQAFKNLYLYTKMRNVAGLSTSEAQKSSDMFGKCRYLDEITGGRGVIFATGTPLSNSMTEMYTLMRYLQYNTLQQKGLTHFDAWACERIRKSRIVNLRLPDGETRRKGIDSTKYLWVAKLRCRCGSSYRIFNWRKLKDGTPVFGYQCNMRTVNPTRSFVLEHNMTQQLSCDAISIPEWKLELMAKKIFEKVWGDQNKAILRACKMIESCQNGKAATRMSAAPIQGQIEKIKKRKLNYAAMRADGELPREEYQTLCKQADDEIAHLEQELKALSPVPEPQTVSSDMKAIYDFLSQKVDVHGARLAPELIDQFVEVVTPIADYSYRWKLNTGCKKSKEERADLMAVSEKPILTFTIDFETAKRYREANKMPHQFRRAAWTDLTVEVYL